MTIALPLLGAEEMLYSCSFGRVGSSARHGLISKETLSARSTCGQRFNFRGRVEVQSRVEESALFGLEGLVGRPFGLVA